MVKIKYDFKTEKENSFNSHCVLLLSYQNVLNDTF